MWNVIWREEKNNNRSTWISHVTYTHIHTRSFTHIRPLLKSSLTVSPSCCVVCVWVLEVYGVRCVHVVSCECVCVCVIQSDNDRRFWIPFRCYCCIIVCIHICCRDACMCVCIYTFCACACLCMDVCTMKIPVRFFIFLIFFFVGQVVRTILRFVSFHFSFCFVYLSYTHRKLFRRKFVLVNVCECANFQWLQFLIGMHVCVCIGYF